MAIRVSGGRDDGDGVVEEFLTVLGDDELVLEDIEVAANSLHHVRQRLLIALGLREVGIRTTPEIILFLEEVDFGIREGRFTVVDEAVEVIGVRVAEEAGRNLLGLDAQLTQALGEPAEVRIGMTLAEAGVDQRNLVTDLQPHDIHVERQRIEALAVKFQGGLHGRTIGLRPHELEALLEEHVAVTDREGLDLADAELVNERIWRALAGRLRRIGRGEARSGGETG